MSTPIEICPHCGKLGYYWTRAYDPCSQCGWFIEKQLPKIEEGTIIHGSMITMDILNAVRRWFVGDISNEYNTFKDIFAALETMGEEFEYLGIPKDTLDDLIDELHDHVSMFLNETVWNYMNEIASRNDLYFGSHPGDGSDFGFWQFEEEE